MASMLSAAKAYLTPDIYKEPSSEEWEKDPWKTLATHSAGTFDKTRLAVLLTESEGPIGDALGAARLLKNLGSLAKSVGDADVLAPLAERMLLSQPHREHNEFSKFLACLPDGVFMQDRVLAAGAQCDVFGKRLGSLSVRILLDILDTQSPAVRDDAMWEKLAVSEAAWDGRCLESFSTALTRGPVWKGESSHAARYYRGLVRLLRDMVRLRGMDAGVRDLLWWMLAYPETHTTQGFKDFCKAIPSKVLMVKDNPLPPEVWRQGRVVSGYPNELAKALAPCLPSLPDVLQVFFDTNRAAEYEANKNSPVVDALLRKAVEQAKPYPSSPLLPWVRLNPEGALHSTHVPPTLCGRFEGVLKLHANLRYAKIADVYAMLNSEDERWKVLHHCTGPTLGPDFSQRTSRLKEQRDFAVFLQHCGWDAEAQSLICNLTRPDLQMYDLEDSFEQRFPNSYLYSGNSHSKTIGDTVEKYRDRLGYTDRCCPFGELYCGDVARWFRERPHRFLMELLLDLERAEEVREHLAGVEAHEGEIVEMCLRVRAVRAVGEKISPKCCDGPDDSAALRWLTYDLKRKDSRLKGIDTYITELVQALYGDTAPGSSMRYLNPDALRLAVVWVDNSHRTHEFFDLLLQQPRPDLLPELCKDDRELQRVIRRDLLSRLYYGIAPCLCRDKCAGFTGVLRRLILLDNEIRAEDVDSLVSVMSRSVDIMALIRATVIRGVVPPLLLSVCRDGQLRANVTLAKQGVPPSKLMDFRHSSGNKVATYFQIAGCCDQSSAPQTLSLQNFLVVAEAIVSELQHSLAVGLRCWDSLPSAELLGIAKAWDSDSKESRVEWRLDMSRKDAVASDLHGFAVSLHREIVLARSSRDPSCPLQVMFSPQEVNRVTAVFDKNVPANLEMPGCFLLASRLGVSLGAVKQDVAQCDNASDFLRQKCVQHPPAGGRVTLFTAADSPALWGSAKFKELAPHAYEVVTSYDDTVFSEHLSLLARKLVSQWVPRALGGRAPRFVLVLDSECTASVLRRAKEVLHEIHAVAQRGTHHQLDILVSHESPLAELAERLFPTQQSVEPAGDLKCGFFESVWCGKGHARSGKTRAIDKKMKQAEGTRAHTSALSIHLNDATKVCEVVGWLRRAPSATPVVFKVSAWSSAAVNGLIFHLCAFRFICDDVGVGYLLAPDRLLFVEVQEDTARRVPVVNIIPQLTLDASGADAPVVPGLPVQLLTACGEVRAKLEAFFRGNNPPFKGLCRHTAEYLSVPLQRCTLSSAKYEPSDPSDPSAPDLPEVKAAIMHDYDEYCPTPYLTYPALSGHIEVLVAADRGGAPSEIQRIANVDPDRCHFLAELQGQGSMRRVLARFFPKAPCNTFVWTPQLVVAAARVAILLKAGLPSVMVGETGCGKTHLMQQLAVMLGMRFLTCDITPSTTRDMLKGFLRQVNKEMSEVEHESGGVLVFFDEFNTCADQELVKDLLWDRRWWEATDEFEAVLANKQVHFACACNPYRELTSGTVKRLAYTVTPCVHQTVQATAWYFPSPLQRHLPLILASMSTSLQSAMPDMQEVEECFEAVRKAVRPMVVSLRDMQRTIHTYAKLHLLFNSWAESEIAPDPKELQHLALFISLVAQTYREVAVDREGVAHSVLKNVIKTWHKWAATLFAHFFAATLPETVFPHMGLRDAMVLGFLCTQLKLPLLLVGAPGTSKSLSVSLLLQCLVDQEFVERHRLQPVQPVHFQCSVNTTQEAVEDLFSGLPDSDHPVAVFDEIGLAELSPHKPLKVFNSKLDQDVDRTSKKYCVIATSNYNVDMSYMNRCVLLRLGSPLGRPVDGGAEVLRLDTPGVTESLAEELGKLFDLHYRTMADAERCRPDAFLLPYLQQLSARDLYSFLADKETKDPIRRVMRAFGFGIRHQKLSVMADVAPDDLELLEQDILHERCAQLASPSPRGLCRPLMVCFGSFLDALSFERGVKSKHPDRHVHVIYGNILQPSPQMLRAHLERVRLAMAHGQTCIVYNAPHLMDSMMDVLNGHTVKIGEQRCARLAAEGTSVLVPVHEGFRFILGMLPQAASMDLRLSLPAVVDRFERREYLPADAHLKLKAEERFLNNLQRQRLPDRNGLWAKFKPCWDTIAARPHSVLVGYYKGLLTDETDVEDVLALVHWTRLLQMLVMSPSVEEDVALSCVDGYLVDMQVRDVIYRAGRARHWLVVGVASDAAGTSVFDTEKRARELLPPGAAADTPVMHLTHDLRDSAIDASLRHASRGSRYCIVMYHADSVTAPDGVASWDLTYTTAALQERIADVCAPETCVVILVALVQRKALDTLHLPPHRSFRAAFCEEVGYYPPSAVVSVDGLSEALRKDGGHLPVFLRPQAESLLDRIAAQWKADRRYLCCESVLDSVQIGASIARAYSHMTHTHRERIFFEVRQTLHYANLQGGDRSLPDKDRATIAKFNELNLPTTGQFLVFPKIAHRTFYRWDTQVGDPDLDFLFDGASVSVPELGHFAQAYRCLRRFCAQAYSKDFLKRHYVSELPQLLAKRLEWLGVIGSPTTTLSIYEALDALCGEVARRCSEQAERGTTTQPFIWGSKTPKTPQGALVDTSSSSKERLMDLKWLEDPPDSLVLPFTTPLSVCCLPFREVEALRRLPDFLRQILSLAGSLVASHGHFSPDTPLSELLGRFSNNFSDNSAIEGLCVRHLTPLLSLARGLGTRRRCVPKSIANLKNEPEFLRSVAERGEQLLGLVVGELPQRPIKEFLEAAGVSLAGVKATLQDVHVGHAEVLVEFALVEAPKGDVRGAAVPAELLFRALCHHGKVAYSEGAMQFEAAWEVADACKTADVLDPLARTLDHSMALTSKRAIALGESFVSMRDGDGGVAFVRRCIEGGCVVAALEEFQGKVSDEEGETCQLCYREVLHSAPVCSCTTLCRACWFESVSGAVREERAVPILCFERKCDWNDLHFAQTSLRLAVETHVVAPPVAERYLLQSAERREGARGYFLCPNKDHAPCGVALSGAGGPEGFCTQCRMRRCTSAECGHALYHPKVPCGDMLFISQPEQQELALKLFRNTMEVREEIERIEKHRKEYYDDEQYKCANCRVCPSCARPVLKSGGCDTMRCGNNTHGPASNTNGCDRRFKWSLASPYRTRPGDGAHFDKLLAELRSRVGSRDHHKKMQEDFDNFNKSEEYKREHCRLCPHCKRVVQHEPGTCTYMECGKDPHRGGTAVHGCGGMFYWDKKMGNIDAPLALPYTSPPPPSMSRVNGVSGGYLECVNCEGVRLQIGESEELYTDHKGSHPNHVWHFVSL